MSWLITPQQKVPVDPVFNNVSLLLHGNGTNGSTTITDSSPSPKTVTAVGNAQISTAQSKFGGSSLAFDGNGDYLTTPANTGFVFSADFTIEMWAYNSTTAGGLGLYTNNSSGEWNSQGNGLHIDNSRIEITGIGSVNYPSGLLALNAWTHIALVRSQSSVVFYRNGVAEITATSNLTIGNGANIPGVGLLDSYSGTPRLFFNGYIDDLRITKGVARYTSNFTPPTAPFPDI